MELPAPTRPVSLPARRAPGARWGTAGAVLLVASLTLPYWRARLYAPQYRDGLTATMYAFTLSGDVQEIDQLNHYIGMRKLGAMAVVERLVAIPSVLALAALVLFAFRRGSSTHRWLAAIAAVIYPVAFVADMKFWMSWATSHLDPTAPLRLKPFAMPVFGTGQVAQFRSVMYPMPGFYLAGAAALVLLIACLRAARAERAGAGAASRPSPVAAALAAMLVLLATAVPGSAQPLQPLLDAAPAGGVVALAPGRYEGPAVIGRALTLRGGPGVEVTGCGAGTILKITAPGIVLEDLVLTGSGDSLLYEDAGVRIEAGPATVRRCLIEDVLFGAFVVQAADVLLEDNVMRGKPIDIGRRGDLIRTWNSDRVTARRNRLEGGRDFVLWYSHGSVVEDNDIIGGRYGLHFMYTNEATVWGNRFADNSVGFYVMYSQHVLIAGNRFERHRGPSGAGLGLKESDWLTVTDNLFVSNRQGIYIDTSPTVPDRPNLVACNRLVRNDIGLAILPGVTGNTFTDNAFEDNLQQASKRGGGQLTGNDWARDGRGNYWSDYTGYGLRGSAVGLAPHRVESGWESLLDRQPLARFFMFTPAATAIEAACRAFPVFRPKPVLIDPAPLLRAPAGLPAAATPGEPAWAVPAGLMALCGVWIALPFAAGGRRSASVPGIVPAARPAPFALSVRGLRKSFGDRIVLDGVELDVAPGRTVALWGSNGAGKSTLIKCVLGIHGYAGRVSVFGHDVAASGESARALTGYVAQELSCYDWSVAQAMAFVAGVRGVPTAAIAPALTRCGLAAHAAKRVTDLSGGMKQKLALAQALLSDPPLLLLDEPCSNLDARSRREFLDILAGLRGSRAIVMTSHRADEVIRLADVVLWLEEGEPARLLESGEFRLAMEREALPWLDLDRAPHREAVG